MNLLIVVSVIFAYFLINHILVDTKILEFINFILALLILITVFGFITYSPDWQNYERHFYYPSNTEEPFFLLSSSIIKGIGGTFCYLHLFFIAFSSLFLIFLVSKFVKNPITVVFPYLLVLFLFYSTQIRFSLAFYLIALAFYFLIVKSNKKIFIILVFFAIINHYSTIVLLPIYFIRNYSFKRLNKFLFALSIGVLVFVVFFSYTFLSIFPHYKNYFTNGQESSFFGSLFTLLPYIISIFFLRIYLVQNISLAPIYTNDLKFKYLYIMTFYIGIFYLPSFMYQVIGKRFIYFGFLFQILILLYSRKYITKSKANVILAFFVLFILFQILYVYFLPNYIGIESDKLEQVLLILRSNKYLTLFI